MIMKQAMFDIDPTENKEMSIMKRKSHCEGRKGEPNTHINKPTSAHLWFTEGLYRPRKI